jgi:hypothetical protein
MKPFSFLRLPVLLLGLGGALMFAPQSRAQSEIAPDHFDGTDSWAAAAGVKVPVRKTRSNAAPATGQARNTKADAITLQPVAAHEATLPHRSDTITANKKRKPVAPKSNN